MKKNWKIGILFSQTGVTAQVEKCMLNASQFAIDELNSCGGVANRLIEPIICDPESDPKQYKRQVLSLLRDHDVRVVFGCYMSSTRKAVLPEIERYRGVLFYPTFYEGFEYSPNCIYTGSAPNQYSIQLARFLTDRYGKKFYLVGSNYVFPYESNRIVAHYLKQTGGKVLQERYIPLNATPSDIEELIKDIKSRRPDVIYSTIVGQSNIMFYQAFRRAGLTGDEMPIASLVTSESDIKEMAPEITIGHISSSSYFEVLDTPVNRRFVSSYKDKFGRNAPVPSSAEAAYFQIHLFAQALEKAGADDVDSLLPHILGAEWEAPQGRVKIDPDNNHTWLWSRIAKVDENGVFKIIAESENAVKPDPYFTFQEAGRWDECCPIRYS